MLRAGALHRSRDHLMPFTAGDGDDQAIRCDGAGVQQPKSVCALLDKWINSSSTRCFFIR